MDISISNKRVYSLIIIIILFFNENTFYLIPNNPYWKLLTIIICIILFVSKTRINKKYKNIFEFVLFFLSMGLISQAYTVFFGLQSALQATIKYQSIWTMIVCIPFLNNSYRFGKRPIRNAFEVIVTFMSIVYIFQSVLYPKFIFITAGLSSRDGMRTVTGGIMFAIGFLLLLGDMVASDSRRERTKYTVAVIIVGYNIINILQTRSLSFAVVAAVYFFILRTVNSSTSIGKPKIMLQLFTLISTIGILIWGIGYFEEILNASLASNESSTINRLGAYRYYFSLFLQHPVFGIGMIRNQSVDGLAQAGIAKNYFIDDIGIVGYIVQYGFIGIFCFYFWIKTVFKYLRQNGDISYWSIFVLLILLLPFNCLLNMDYGVIYIAFFFVMLARE